MAQAVSTGWSARGRELPQPSAVLVAAPCVAFLVAAAAASGQLLPAAAVAAVLAALAVATWPWTAVVLVLVLGATAFSSEALPLDVGPVRTDVAELLVVVLVAAHAVVPAVLGRRAPHATRWTGRLVVALAAVAVAGAAHGLLAGADRGKAQGVLKDYLLVLVALPLLRVVASPEARDRLERAVVAVATAASAYVLLAQPLGLPVVSESPTRLNTLGIEPGVDRVRPLLVSLLVLAVLLVQAEVHRHGLGVRRALQLVSFWAVLLLSFNRTSWLPLLACSVLLLLVHRERRDVRRTAAVVVASLLAASGVLALAAGGQLGRTPAAVVDRLGSVVDTDVLAEHSYQDRAAETEQALRAIAASPVVGIGIGTTYGYGLVVQDPDTGVRRLVERDFTHNSVLLLWLHLGLAGVAVGFLLVCRVVALVRRACATASSEATRALAASLALLALLASALAEPYLYYRPWLLTAVVALVLCHVRTTRP